MRKMIAIGLCLCLLLCGCGGNETTPASTTAAGNSAVSVPAEVSAAEVVAEPSVHEDGGPTDPVELAKWVWAMADETSDNHYAEDYDLSMTMEMDMDGEYSFTQISARIKTISSATGNYAYSKADGTTWAGDYPSNTYTESWYGDGMYYLSDSLGNYKVPMTYEEYEAQDDASDDSSSQMIAELNPEDFGSLYASRTDLGYTVTFSKPTLETWMAFSGLLTSDDQESITCEAFSLSGTIQCDLDGNITQLKLDMTITVDIMGVPMTMQYEANQITMGYDNKVKIELPTEDETYLELPNLSIPTALYTSQLITNALPSLQYQGVYLITLADDYSVETILQTDNIGYITDDVGVRGVWNTVVTTNDETTYSSSDVFEYGSGIFTDPEGEQPYECNDSQFIDSIQTMITANLSTFSFGTDFQLSEENGVSVLTYNLEQTYVEEWMLNTLDAIDIAYFMDDSDIQASSGTVSLWIDASGLLISNIATLNVEVIYEDTPVTLSLQTGGDIVAIGDSVVLE